MEITQQQIRDALIYCEETGRFRWRHSRGRCAAGTIAGYDVDRGYRCIRLFGKIMYEHRAVFLYMTGVLPEEVDHINGVRSDNRWENLRQSNRADNSKNMKTPSTNKSGVIGVFWNKGKQKWTARIKVNQRNLHLGHFHQLADAIEARGKAEKEHGFHENHGRIGPRGVMLEFPEASR